MNQFAVYENGIICDLLVEPESWPGVRKLADTVAEDLSLVTGKTPLIRDSLSECESETVVLIATVGRSPLLEKIMEDAVNSGARMAVLETQSFNSKAISFYQKNGFEIIGFDRYAYSNKGPEEHNMRIEMGRKL